MAINQKGFTVDAALRLKDAGAVTASGNAQVGGSDRILDLGAGRMDFRAILDVAAIDTTSADESYRIRLQLSNSATFASGIVTAATAELGVASATGSSAATAAGTRVELAGCNEFNGVVYRYARLTHVIAGTTPSINYQGWLVKTAQ